MTQIKFPSVQSNGVWLEKKFNMTFLTLVFLKKVEALSTVPGIEDSINSSYYLYNKFVN